MPALPNVPKVIRTMLQFSEGPNTRIFTHFYYQYSGAMSTTDLTTVTNTLITAFKNNILNLLNVSLTINSATATDLTSTTAPQVVVSTSGAGGVATAAHPNGTAMVVELKIARRFRGGHARVYLPGTSNAQILDTVRWTTAAVTAMNSGFTAFNTAAILTPPAAVGTLTPVTVSFFLGFTNRTFPSGRTRAVPTLRGVPVVDTVIGYVTNPKAASQRRRNLQSL